MGGYFIRMMPPDCSVDSEVHRGVLIQTLDPFTLGLISVVANHNLNPSAMSRIGQSLTFQEHWIERSPVLGHLGDAKQGKAKGGKAKGTQLIVLAALFH